jgi:hypothetical protein
MSIVDNEGNVGQYTSLVLVNNQPVIFYYDVTNQNLKVASLVDNQWLIMVVDSEGDVGRFASAAYNQAAGTVGVTYFNATDDNLKFAYFTGENWFITTVVSEGDVGRYNSLGFDSLGRPHISYYNATNTDLIYVFGNAVQPTEWTFETVDSNGDVGQYTSLGVFQDQVLISYYDATNGNLKTARSTTQGWVINIVDDDNNVGQFTSLAIDQNGIPGIAYHDVFNRNLKFARFILFTWNNN